MNWFSRRWLPEETWRRNAYALTAASFITSLGFVFVMPLLPLLLSEMLDNDLAASTAWAGATFAATPLAAALVTPVWGRLGDRFGHRLMVLRALVAIGVLMGLMGLANSPLQMVLLRGAVGALGAFSPAAMAAIASSTPIEQTARAIGLLQAAQVSGGIVGPLIGGVLADHLGLRSPFAAVVVLFAAAFFLVRGLYRDAPARLAEASTPASAGRVGGLWALWLCLFAVQFSDSTYGPLLPLYLRSLGTPAENTASVAGFTVSLGALGMAAAAYLAPQMRGRRLADVVRASLVGSALLSLPVAAASSWWQVPPLRAGVGLLCGAILTLTYTMAAQRAGPGRQGMTIATLASAGMLGWASGPLVAAALAGFGPRPVFAVDALLFASCAVAWTVSQRRLACPPPAVVTAAAEAAVPAPEAVTTAPTDGDNG